MFEREKKRAFVRKPEAKRPPGRSRHGWQYIEMDFKELGEEGVKLIHLV